MGVIAAIQAAPVLSKACIYSRSLLFETPDCLEVVRRKEQVAAGDEGSRRGTQFVTNRHVPRLELGGLFGALFGAVQDRLQGDTQITPGRSLVTGLLTGIAFWVVIRLGFGTLINHQRLDLTGFLYSFVPLLLYGMLLGTIFFQRAAREMV